MSFGQLPAYLRHVLSFVAFRRCFSGMIFVVHVEIKRTSSALVESTTGAPSVQSCVGIAWVGDSLVHCGWASASLFVPVLLFPVASLNARKQAVN